jgi:phosphatidate phosphatase APP1
MSDRHDSDEPAGAPDGPGLKLRLKARLGFLGDLKLLAYWSHGTRDFLHVKGRLIEAQGASGRIGSEGSVLRNVVTALHRLESDEIPGARLRVHFQHRTYDLYTDNEGFFNINLYPPQPLDAGWHEVEIGLLDSVKVDASASTTARVLVPPDDAGIAVVSDLDDTVIHTSVTDTIEMVRLTLVEDAATRMAFPGVADLYQALERGPEGDGRNPLFYVSKSGWNLYDLFTEFFELNGIPRGPLFLRDLAFFERPSTALGSAQHKLSRIRELLVLYPKLPFVLIGDSGQHDAQIYRQIALEHPGRVRAVYLRQVTAESRNREIDAIIADLRRRGVPAVLADDSGSFAKHMQAQGLIASTA